MYTIYTLVVRQDELHQHCALQAQTQLVRDV